MLEFDIFWEPSLLPVIFDLLVHQKFVSTALSRQVLKRRYFKEEPTSQLRINKKAFYNNKYCLCKLRSEKACNLAEEELNE